MSLRSQLEGYACTGREAEPLVNAMFDAIIATLKRDPRISLSRGDLELLLADQRSIAEERLASEFVGMVSIDWADFVDGGDYDA